MLMVDPLPLSNITDTDTFRLNHGDSNHPASLGPAIAVTTPRPFRHTLPVPQVTTGAPR